MTRRKIIIILVLVLTLGGLWYFNLPYYIKCLGARQDLKSHFHENKKNFYALISLLDKSSPIQFDIRSGDSMYLTFQDTSIDFSDIFIDSTYNMYPGNKSEFLINRNGCLIVINKGDTIEVCNHNWQVNFYGHFKDKRIDNLLNYIGWTKSSFENIMVKVKELGCHNFFTQNGNFGLGFKRISYYNDSGLHCFGHSDGYFDYLYTTEPDSFQWKESLVKYEGNFYGIEYW